MNAGGRKVAPSPVGHPGSAALLRAYCDGIVGRHHGRRATDGEVDAALAEEPGGDLTDPTGRFPVGRYGGRPAGCADLRVLDARTAELTRLSVRPAVREAFGARAVRLDARADFVEACALYARHGYTEIPDCDGAKCADHWFEKRLGRR